MQTFNFNLKVTVRARDAETAKAYLAHSTIFQMVGVDPTIASVEVLRDKAVSQLRDEGCAVAIFTAEELRGADPDRVQDRLVEEGNEIIDILAGPEPDDEELGPTHGNDKV